MKKYVKKFVIDSVAPPVDHKGAGLAKENGEEDFESLEKLAPLLSWSFTLSFSPSHTHSLSFQIASGL